VTCDQDKDLAYHAGRELGALGFTLHHGGYNGLMEHAARGAASVGAQVVAVTLRGKKAWGPFNPYVTDSIHAGSLGDRLFHLIERADAIVAMGGGVGCLHELTTAIWYAGNIRAVPIILLGTTAGRLELFLREERWLYTSSTRSLDFLHRSETANDLTDLLMELPPPHAESSSAAHLALEQRIRHAAYVYEPYRLPDGRTQSPFFDPFRLASQPELSMELAEAMATRVTEDVDVVVGLALGGVVLATNVAAVLRRPLLIARPAPKAYGQFTQLEGSIRRGDRALIVDDVVRSGEHMMRAARLLIDQGLVVRTAICVVERVNAGRSRLAASGILLNSMIVDHAT
jgi:uncharacterized protein (TIGR00725 family)